MTRRAQFGSSESNPTPAAWSNEINEIHTPDATETEIQSAINTASQFDVIIPKVGQVNVSSGLTVDKDLYIDFSPVEFLVDASLSAPLVDFDLTHSSRTASPGGIYNFRQIDAQSNDPGTALIRVSGPSSFNKFTNGRILNLAGDGIRVQASQFSEACLHNVFENWQATGNSGLFVKNDQYCNDSHFIDCRCWGVDNGFDINGVYTKMFGCRTFSTNSWAYRFSGEYGYLEAFAEDAGEDSFVLDSGRWLNLNLSSIAASQNTDATYDHLTTKTDVPGFVEGNNVTIHCDDPRSNVANYAVNEDGGTNGQGNRYEVVVSQYNALGSDPPVNLDNAGSAVTFASGFDWKYGSATLDFPSISAGDTAELTISVAGAEVGDPVRLGAPDTIEAGLVWSGYVSSAGTVTVRVHNTTAGAIDPASATWSVNCRTVVHQ